MFNIQLYNSCKNRLVTCFREIWYQNFQMSTILLNCNFSHDSDESFMLRSYIFRLFPIDFCVKKLHNVSAGKNARRLQVKTILIHRNLGTYRTT